MPTTRTECPKCQSIDIYRDYIGILSCHCGWYEKVHRWGIEDD